MALTAIDAATLRAGGEGEIHLELHGDRLLVVHSSARYAALDAVAFARTALGGCERKP